GSLLETVYPNGTSHSHDERTVLDVNVTIYASTVEWEGALEMSMKAYQTYQQNSVNTASGGELTLMLYNGARKFLKQAMKDMENNDYEAKNINIQKGQNIIQELLITLDPNVELSKQMAPIYEFMLVH